MKKNSRNSRSREESIIDSLRMSLPRKEGIGIGDDAALLHLSALEKDQLLIATDSLCEEIHFTRRFCRPEDIAVKLVSVNVSDILIKGGRALYALANFSISADFLPLLPAFSRTLKKELLRHGIRLIGGDTTRAKSTVFSLTLLGSCDDMIPRARKSVQPGDPVVLIGFTGESALAFEMLSAGEKISPALKKKYIRPAPQFTVETLRNLGAKASIDTSDSLLESLRHLAESGRIRIAVDADVIPVSPWIRRYRPEKAMDYLLTGGEDLAALAIIPPGLRLPPGCKTIGSVSRSRKRGVHFYLEDHPVPVSHLTGRKIFSHFD